MNMHIGKILNVFYMNSVQKWSEWRFLLYTKVSVLYEKMNEDVIAEETTVGKHRNEDAAPFRLELQER